jgi:hypothetical protein
MARLVVGGAPPILRAEHHLALGTEHDPLERVGEIAHLDVLVRAPRRQQRRLICEVFEVGPNHPTVVAARLSRSAATASPWPTWSP